MKVVNILLVALFLVSNNIAKCQISLKPKSTTKGQTYGIIIGISEYKDDRIRDLNYAHKDAEEFANYLFSKSGGSVPTENIELLLNENATIANIYLAKDKIEQKVKKGDRLYFYFSGHGDVENSLYELGFLIAHDTPFGNYLNNAVRIEDINIMANTLSVIKEVEVILITDACHSGKLAGSDNRGKSLVGAQLSKVQKNEIRIASCQSDQLSQEDQVWGGGRGVFSWFLINGLKGLADDETQDGLISLIELEEYLEDNVPAEVIKVKREEQVPVIEGKKFTTISIVDSEELAVLKLNPEKNTNTSSESLGSKSIDISQERKILASIRETNLREKYNFNEWTKLSKEKLVKHAINQLEIDKSNLDKKDNYKTFRNALAAKLHDEVQNAINAYLNGSEDELELRQYYSKDKEIYNEYISMLEVALELIDDNSSLNHILTVKLHYFKGLNARLKILHFKNRDSLIKIAYQEQSKAIALEPLAAYIQNEMGIISKIKKEPHAQKYFEKAIEIAPTWSLPYSNLSSLHFRNRDFELGEKYSRKSIELGPQLYNGYVQLARNAAMQKNYLVAEENLLKAIKTNSRHFRPYFELGQLYSILTNYEEADFNFHEAELKKRGFNLMAPDLMDEDADGIINLLDSETVSIPDDCKLDSSLFDKKDVFAYFIQGIKYLEQRNYHAAIRNFKTAINNDMDNPIAYKYLADSYYQNSQWLESEYYYQKAVTYHRGYDEFEQDAKALFSTQVYQDCHVYDKYIAAYFPSEDLQYLLANVYTQMKKFEKSINIYTQRIKLNEPAAYFLLLEILESQKRYKEAENVIISMSNFDLALSKNRLLRFYDDRILNKENANTYKYFAGMLLYNWDNYNNLYLSKEKDIEFLNHQKIDHNVSTITPGTERELSFYIYPIIDIPERALSYLVSIENIEEYDSSYVAEINFRKGILYNKSNKTELAYSCFENALKYNPQNSSFADEYINSAMPFYHFESIHSILDLQAENNQLEYNHLNLYAEYNMKSGRYSKCTENILALREINFEDDPKLYLLESKNSYLGDEKILAIEQYKNLAKKGIIPEYELNYTLARLHAITNQNSEALDYLQKAIDGGFNFPYVIRNDSQLEKYSEEHIFQSILNSLPLPQLD